MYSQRRSGGSSLWVFLCVCYKRESVDKTEAMGCDIDTMKKVLREYSKKYHRTCWRSVFTLKNRKGHRIIKNAYDSI